ncbi:MAG: nucleotidyltransferase family protein, partial [Clostridia bacterium]|nr:nucleotidyltransferase family protein [Clostridia bacterium]
SLGRAKTHALQECIDEGFVKFTNPEMVAQLLESPNNILGIEYLRVLLKSGRTDITPITVQRISAYQDADDLEIEYNLTNATAIRESVYNSKRIWNIRKYIPTEAFKIFSKSLQTLGIPDLQTWENVILYRFRTASPNELKLNFDVCEGIENKLITSAREQIELKPFIESCVSRRFTQARIQRIITACLLSIREEYVKHIYEIDKLPFIKVLAIKQNNNLLASLNECNTPLITRKQDALEALKDPYAKILMFAEDKANNLYSLLLDITKEQQKAFSTSDIYQKPLFIK